MIDISKAYIHGIGPGLSTRFRAIKKIWGSEFIIPNETSDYTTKILVAKPGSTISLHFHGEKSETWVLIQGSAEITYYDPEGNKHVASLCNLLDSLVISRCTPHTFSIPKDQDCNTIIVESSTIDQSNDSYRLTKSSAE